MASHCIRADAGLQTRVKVSAASSAGRTRTLSGGSIRRSHFLSLILLNQSIASLRHTGARRFIRRSSVKIGVAKSNVSLALLKESRGIGYSSTVCSDPSHFGSSLRCYATRKDVEYGDCAKDGSAAQAGVMTDWVFPVTVHTQPSHHSNYPCALLRRSCISLPGLKCGMFF
jgi:hypothetical protein